MNLPTDIANQALDAAGVDFTLGDLEEGTRPAQVLLRAYGQCLRQLLRGCNWDFARKQAPLTLLADSSGQTPNVGTMVPVPWLYSYAYPTDCSKVRFIPWNQANQTPTVPPVNIVPQNSNSPVVTGLGQPPLSNVRIVPARFTVATDPNFTAAPGSNWWESQGQSPQGNTVILTNVQNANLIYTVTAIYPSVWDHQFRAALVSYLASEICLPLHKDKKLALALRPQLIATTKEKLTQARITDGNEGWYSSDIRVDWMAFRNAGMGGPWSGAGTGFNGGPGYLGYGWDSVGFCDGSAF